MNVMEVMGWLGCEGVEIDCRSEPMECGHMRGGLLGLEY